MSRVRVPTCPGKCRSACTALSTWAAGNRWLRSGPRRHCRPSGPRRPRALQPPPAVQKSGTPGRSVAGPGPLGGLHPKKPLTFSPSRLPPFPPKNDVLGCRGVTDPSCEGDPGPEAGQPRRICCSGRSEALGYVLTGGEDVGSPPEWRYPSRAESALKSSSLFVAQVIAHGRPPNMLRSNVGATVFRPTWTDPPGPTKWPETRSITSPPTSKPILSSSALTNRYPTMEPNSDSSPSRSA